MGLTDKHLAYGDDIPKTQAEKDYYWELKNLKEKQQVPKKSADMTREEAINELKDIRGIFATPTAEAIDTAIEALEQVDKIYKISQINSAEDLDGINWEETVIGLLKTVMGCEVSE